jgi:hypothetical protein
VWLTHCILREAEAREILLLTEEATMDAIPKIVVMFCGLLLCLDLSGNAASAAHEMKAGPTGERIGGQAGWEYDRGHDQNKQESIAAQAGERIGGQAGLGYEQDKRQRMAAQ